MRQGPMDVLLPRLLLSPLSGCLGPRLLLFVAGHHLLNCAARWVLDGGALGIAQALDGCHLLRKRQGRADVEAAGLGGVGVFCLDDFVHLLFKLIHQGVFYCGTFLLWHGFDGVHLIDGSKLFGVFDPIEINRLEATWKFRRISRCSRSSTGIYGLLTWELLLAFPVGLNFLYQDSCMP